jgi:hypothetical protein
MLEKEISQKISTLINFLNLWLESIRNEVLKHEIERKITQKYSK